MTAQPLSFEEFFERHSPCEVPCKGCRIQYQHYLERREAVAKRNTEEKS